MGIYNWLQLPGPALGVSGKPSACAHCECKDLYWQPDFNRSIGLWIVGIASAATVPLMVLGYNWWIIWSPMFAALLLDLLFRRISHDAVICYRCGVIHRGLTKDEARTFAAFDLDTFDRYRYAEMEVAKTPST